jgi:hypothetical protein
MIHENKIKLSSLNPEKGGSVPIYPETEKFLGISNLRNLAEIAEHLPGVPQYG